LGWRFLAQNFALLANFDPVELWTLKPWYTLLYVEVR
jgi:hypothetical protein